MSQRITDVDELLGRETMMAVHLLGTGLTSIRKYNFTSKGSFYSGMFSVTIGLERILKLILLLNYKINNNCYPDDDFLRRKGHKIKALIKDCKEINDNLIDTKLKNSQETFDDLLVRKIVNFLTQFSTDTRYYNLNVVTGESTNLNEPLAHWDNEICLIILNRHPPSKKKIEEYKNSAMALEPYSIVHHTHENGSHIGDVNSLFHQSSFIEEKQGYSVYYIYKIVSFAIELLVELDFKMNP